MDRVMSHSLKRNVTGFVTKGIKNTQKRPAAKQIANYSLAEQKINKTKKLITYD